MCVLFLSGPRAWWTKISVLSAQMVETWSVAIVVPLLITWCVCVCVCECVVSYSMAGIVLYSIALLSLRLSCSLYGWLQLHYSLSIPLFLSASLLLLVFPNLSVTNTDIIWCSCGICLHCSFVFLSRADRPRAMEMTTTRTRVVQSGPVRVTAARCVVSGNQSCCTPKPLP